MNDLFKLFDTYPAIPVGIMATLLLAIIMRLVKRKASPKKPVTGLDAPLLWWTQSDALKVRDLLNGGALILGRAGSGKTSSSGRMLMQAIVNFDEEDVK